MRGSTWRFNGGIPQKINDFLSLAYAMDLSHHGGFLEHGSLEVLLESVNRKSSPEICHVKSNLGRAE